MDNFIVEKIDGWRQGKEKLPEYRIMSKYIGDSEKLKDITALLKKDIRYKAIRDRCNNHTHYNYYYYLLLNDNEVFLADRIKQLEQLSNDLRNIYIQHMAYIFTIRDIYMVASDYIDYLECGMTPEENSQYWAANFVQVMFDNVIKKHRPDIAAEIKKNTSMELK
jgi:hypothetical protein